MAMTMRLIERDPDDDGIGVCAGPSGYGKTYASIFARARTGAKRVEVGDSWTRRTLLRNILHEFGISVKRSNAALSDMAQEVIAALGDDPRRPLIIDEADKLVDKKMIELVRELHDSSHAPIILIGEERLPDKLLGVERFHNRVNDWMQAQPCDLEDARALVDAIVSQVTITDDLLDMIRQQSGGRARRIVRNARRVAEFARNRGFKTVDCAAWGSEPLYTGEPPHARVIEPYKRVRAA
jgi:DNA transposition AAA+ family ATPase